MRRTNPQSNTSWESWINVLHSQKKNALKHYWHICRITMSAAASNTKQNFKWMQGMEATQSILSTVLSGRAVLKPINGAQCFHPCRALILSCIPSRRDDNWGQSSIQRTWRHWGFCSPSLMQWFTHEKYIDLCIFNLYFLLGIMVS